MLVEEAFWPLKKKLRKFSFKTVMSGGFPETKCDK